MSHGQPRAGERGRRLGLLPLLFFAVHFYFNLRAGKPYQMLWMCNLSNLVLALGLLLRQPGLVRVAVIWLIPAVPLWAWELIAGRAYHPSTFLVHIGGPAVGLIALCRVRAARYTWIWGSAFGGVMQLISRFTTPPADNVNVAHRLWDTSSFGANSYWQFWLAVAALTLGALWSMNRLLYKLFPPGGSGGARTHM